MIGNFHMVPRLALDRHEELIREAARERAATAVAGPSLRARVARALARGGTSAGPTPTTMPAPSLSGAGR